MTERNKLIADEIKRLKIEKNALILAHYYQVPEIQEIADYTGDSLGLSQYASQTNARMIVFAGVHFMAETAKILNPERKVVIPDIEASCSLADSCPAEDFKTFKRNYPDHMVISYINCSAEIKAMSDLICTSGNALEIVKSIPREIKILFTPDINLGRYINNITGKNMILWNGSCHVHNQLNIENVIKLKIANPDALLVAHPECKELIVELADFVGSTTALLKFTTSSNAKKFIVATETGILHQMKKNCPDKEFIIVPSDENCSCNDCSYMKLITMEKLLASLKNETAEIFLPDDLMKKAEIPIRRMLEMSRSLRLI